MNKLYYIVIILFLLPISQLKSQELNEFQIEYKDGYVLKTKEGSEMTDVEREDQYFSDHIMEFFKKSCRNYEYDHPIKFDSLCINILAEEKVKKLAEANAVIAAYLACDMQGKVINVTFKIVRANVTDVDDNLSDISINEIKKIDEQLRNNKYKIISGDCSDADYFTPGETCYFGKFR